MYVLYAELVVNLILYYRMLYCVFSLDLPCLPEEWLIRCMLLIIDIIMIIMMTLIVQDIIIIMSMIRIWIFVVIFKLSLFLRLLLQ